MKRKSKSYAKPMKPFEAGRIKEENQLVTEFGLKNKREIWKALAKINYYRKRAMMLSAEGDQERQNAFFGKLKGIGLNVDSIADVLDLQVKDLLKRRLPTIVAEKGLAKGVKHARQLVVHKKILIGDRVVNTPSFIVPVSEEGGVKMKVKKKVVVEKKEDKVEVKVAEKAKEGGEKVEKAAEKAEVKVEEKAAAEGDKVEAAENKEKIKTEENVEVEKKIESGEVKGEKEKIKEGIKNE